MLDVAPRFDDATEYSFDWNESLVQDLSRHFPEMELLFKDYALRKNFEPSVPNHDIVIFYDHGNETSLIEQGGNGAILDLDNIDLVKGKAVYTMACLSAKELGVKAWQKGCLEYWGAKEVIGFTPDDHELFKECYNLGVIWRFVERQPIKTCLTAVKNRFTMNMDKTDDPWAKTWLRYDRDNWVCWSDETPPDDNISDCFFRRLSVRIFGKKGWVFFPEFWNVVFAAIAGGILGAALHSAWLHSKKRGERILKYFLKIMGMNVQK